MPPKAAKATTKKAPAKKTAAKATAPPAQRRARPTNEDLTKQLQAAQRAKQALTRERDKGRTRAAELEQEVEHLRARLQEHDPKSIVAELRSVRASLEAVASQLDALSLPAGPETMTVHMRGADGAVREGIIHWVPVATLTDDEQEPVD